MKHKIKSVLVILVAMSLLVSLSGCAMFESELNSLNGSITGNTYECQFYSNDGNKFMTLTGQKIDIGSNIANIVNEYKNAFGKPVVVVIQSQLGNPICAFSGNDVYWEVCEDLPKTTKLMIDGHALYIHRANFQLIDKDLLG